MEPTSRNQRRLAKKRAGGGASNPRPVADALFAEALRLHQAGSLAEAEKLYRQLLARDRRHADALHLLGVIAHQRGQHATAVELIISALKLKSDDPAYYNNLGSALQAEGKLGDAVARYERALALNPAFPEAHSNLGNALKDQGRLDDAVAHYRRAIALSPLVAETHYNLGLALRLQGTLDEAFAEIALHAQLKFGAGHAAAGEGKPFAHKLKHDREQLDYLIATGGADLGIQRARDALAQSPERFAEIFDRLFHIEGGARVARPAINPALDAASLESAWDEARPQVAVIDDLLTPQALAELRRFCWGSTIWRLAYRNGYLGAFPDTGFACPLLAQIAEELAAKLPGIIGQNRLMQWWGFKYDSTLQGINVHADLAAVNVNFWITPDEANLDPQSGGLVVWDVPAPLDWDFDKYNNDAQAIRDFLAASHARSVTVPHRCNRAVIFDSDLFHETDRLSFREGYLNRRLNITLLYGLRHGAAVG